MGRPTRFAATARLACAALTLGAMSGCMSDVDTSSENSFPQRDGTETGFSDSSSGDACRTSNLANNEVRVSVQVPEGRTSGEAGRRNLVTTSDATLEVGRAGNSINSLTLMDTQVERDRNGFILTFPDRADVPRDLDAVVRAHIGNDTYHAPVASGCRHVRVNPFSDYLARAVFDTFSASERQQIDNCQNEPCLRTLIWPSLVDQVQHFEIDINSDLSAGSAVSSLEDRADFTGFVDQALSSMLLGNTGSVSESEASVTDFNSVYFGVELNRDEQNDGTPFWAARSMDRGFTTDSNGTAFAYPRMTLTSFAFELIDIDITSFDSDIPYQRSSGGASELDDPLNTQATQPGPAFTRGDDYLMGPRSVYQSITRPDNLSVGWAPDPYFMDSRILGDTNDASALLNSYFHAGKAIELDEDSGSPQRQETLETLATAALEINLGRHSDDTAPSFGAEYNQVALELAPSESGSIVRAKSGRWKNIDSNGTGDEENDEYWRLTLDSQSTTEASGTMDDSIEITPIDFLSATDQSSEYRGHLFLNYDSAHTDMGYTDTGDRAPRTPNGAISPDGSLMAFSSRPEGRGYAIQIAGEPASNIDSDDLIGSYNVQGVSLSPDGLNQYRNACLQVGTSNVEFIPAGIRISADENDSGSPDELDDAALSFGSTDSLENDGRFSASDGSDNALNGFVIAEDRTLILTSKTSQGLGILLGFRQSSNPEDCG